jgi:hypothetical protein
MNIKNVSGMLLGTCIVYVTMAACSATDRIQLSAGGAGGTGGMAGSSGTGEMASSSGMGGMASSSGMGGMASSSGMGGAIGMGGTGGTGGSPNASADPVSGTRLKAKYMKADDGARAPIADVWHDSQRNEECRFQRASDGKRRCLPTSVTYHSGYYADASCTQPINMMYGGGGCAPEIYLAEYNSTCYPYSLSYRLIGSQIQPATIYAKSGATCTSSPAPAGYTFFATGAAISPSAFVAGVVEIDP